jgi:CheY-like chemotaxis protein
VDDEQNPLILRKMVLERAGYTVILATSAADALLILSSRDVDLVLSDQLMPGMVGTELARKVKQDNPNLPVIVLSGVNEIPPDAASADLFLSKLEGPERLCDKISSVLAGKIRQGAGSS